MLMEVKIGLFKDVTSGLVLISLVGNCDITESVMC